MELVLVRHAQPEWVRDERGVLDPVLTALGHRQAERFAAAWPEEKRPTHLWVSPAARARQTAEPLAERFGLEPEIHADLTEVRLPARFEGAHAREVGRLIMSAKHRPPEAWWTGIEDGEPFADFHRRVTTCLNAQLARFGLQAPSAPEDPRWGGPDDLDARVMVVAHGGTNAALSAHLLGFLPRPWIWETFLLAHTGTIRLKARRLMGARVFGLVSHGGLEHLEPSERSR